MKSIIALLVTVCVASAASLGPRDSSAESLTPRNFLAVCNAKRGESCAGSGQRACENNGGHSMLCIASSQGKFNWIYADNCPDSNAHCDCADGFCKPN